MIEEILSKYPKYYPIPKFVYVVISIAVIHRFHDTYISEKAKTDLTLLKQDVFSGVYFLVDCKCVIRKQFSLLLRKYHSTIRHHTCGLTNQLRMSKAPYVQ